MPYPTPSQLEQFESDGYLVMDDALSPEHDLQPVLAEYEEVLDKVAHSLYAEGTTQSTYAEFSFAERLIKISSETGCSFSQHFDISLPQSTICPDTPIHLGPAVFALLTNDRLLDLIEPFIGGEILVSPVQHIRLKLPIAVLTKTTDGLMGSVPWHQDNGVLLPEADGSGILTVWIPLNDATLANGCLAVLPGSHRDGLQVHCPSPTKGPHLPAPFVPVDRVSPLPMSAGSVLLMDQRTVHSSLDNKTTDEVRLSLDLRFQPVDQPTGRPQFPSFVARSTRDPGSELRDAATWAQLWLDARAKLARAEPAIFNRWSSDAPACA